MKHSNSEKVKKNEKLLFSQKMNPADMLIDDHGFMKFLVTGADLSRFGINLTIKNPLTGENINIESSTDIPDSKLYMDQLNNPERTCAKKELEMANLVLETDTAILEKISKVIEYKDDLWSTVTHSISCSSIDAGSILFRVRKIWDDSVRAESVKDLSYVPDEKKDLIRYGRLNDRKEQIMYLADSYITAMKESRLEKGDKFYLSIFVNKDDLKLVNIRQQLENNGKYGDVENKISEFLFSEFTKVVPEGQEYKYRISNLIAKYYYSYSVNDLDGWLYPSIARNKSSNIALDKKITDKKIKFVVSFHGEQISETDFTLENPLVKSIRSDTLIELKTVINTEEIKSFDLKDLELIKNFWLSFAQY